jgi:hypothetical protein
VPTGKRGTLASTNSSSELSAVVITSTKNSWAATILSLCALRKTKEAFNVVIATGNSADGKA